MTRIDFNEEYFKWMYYLVFDEKRLKNKFYYSLFEYLHGVDFSYSIDMDGNRAEDGVDLRYRFGYERGYPDSLVTAYLDNRPCSVLEMMVALAVRCEEHIMEDSEAGDQTSRWFWEMIESLGLEEMDDSHFDQKRTEKIVDKFLERRYRRDGKGGLFTVENPSKDMRSTEIWYQLCMYLNTIL